MSQISIKQGVHTFINERSDRIKFLIKSNLMLILIQSNRRLYDK